MNYLTGSLGRTLRQPQPTFLSTAVIWSSRTLGSKFRLTPLKAYAKSSSSANTTTPSSLFPPTGKGTPKSQHQTLPSFFSKLPQEVNSTSLIRNPSSTSPRRKNSQRGRDAHCSGKRKAIRRRGHTAPTVNVSLEMALLASRIHEEGYLKDRSFISEGKYDPNRISAQEYSRGLLSALMKFGQNKQEIAKSLSGLHLKKISLLGCPSSDKLTIFAAKSLRSFFSIHEDTVCKGCKIKSLCKFANKKLVGKQKLALRDVLLVIVGYMLPSPFHCLWKRLSDDIQHSISKVLKEINNLTL